jgi:hypothetical protein
MTVTKILCAICCLLFSICFSQAQQVVKVLPSDNVNLSVDVQDGGIQWQLSADQIAWTDIAGGDQKLLAYSVSSLPVFLRAQINEVHCEIRYSDITKLERLIVVPQIQTNAISSVSSTSALTGGNTIFDGGGSVLEKGVVFSLASSPTLANTKVVAGAGNSDFNSALETLTPSTFYYVRAYATNAVGTGYGNELSFTTPAISPTVVAPSVVTASVSLITSISASCGGNITNDGGALITGRGVVYGTSAVPTLSNNVVPAGNANASFISSLTNLSAATEYFVRAYATNSSGTAYGNQQSFTTSAVVALASVSTTTYSALTKSSVNFSATLSPSGSISSKGFVIGTTSSPAIANSQTVAGSGGIAFTGSATGLASGVVYYVRAFATNEAGTAYGSEVSFRTNDSNVILMFVSHQQTYYSEYIVMKKALEVSGYIVEVRSSANVPASLYMTPVQTTISATAATLPGGSHLQFTQQFQNLFGAAWDESLDAYPATTLVDGRIQDVADMGPYRALVVVGGLGALAYRVDGVYEAQGAVSATDVEAASLKLNSLALNALSTGKPVMAQCHSASLPVFWRVPGTTGTGVETLGYSLLKGQPATGFPDGETPTTLQSFGVNHRASNINDGDRITIASPHASFNDNGQGDYKILTTRDWYPQTVAHAARTLLNIFESYPTKQQATAARSVLILHGGAVNTSNCSAANRSNDVPCNYGNGAAELPADYTDLQSLLADSPNDDYVFTVSQANISNAGFPSGQQDILNYIDDYDVVVFYKHWSTGITNALLNAIVTYADNGGGVLAIHHGLYNDQEGPQNKDILVNQLFGAQSAPWTSLDDGTRLTYRLFSTNYGHFISTYGVNLAPTNPSLPAPAPWSATPLNAKANASFSYYHNFQLYDELYDNMQFQPGVVFGRNVNEITPLFSNDQNPSPQAHVAGFVKVFNQTGSDLGRVAYFQPGERKENYAQPSIYGQVLRNAIVWLSN